MKNKIYAALLSLACAFCLWLYVISAVSPGSTDTYYNIPIVWEGESLLNENGLMVTAVSSNTVNLKLSGNRSDLSRVNSGNITIKADLSAIREPGSQIRINYSTPTFPGDVASNAFVIESKDPDSIYVTVVRRVSKTVPVEVIWNGSPAEGFMIDRENKVLDFPSVTVTGPEAVVDSIAKATIAVDLEGRRESISETYHYTLCDENGDPVDAKLITTDVEEVRLEVAIRRVKDLRLTYNLVEGGGANQNNTTITLSAETIRVSGGEAVLNELGDTFTVCSVNLADLDKSSTEQKYTITLPEGVTNQTGVNEVTVSIRMTGLKTREFNIDKFEAVNVPEGLSAEIINANLSIKVRGPEAEIAALQEENIRAVVDFTNAEEGTATY